MKHAIVYFTFTYFKGNYIAHVSFRSKDEEIELVPEAEFFRDAPKEISKPVSNFDSSYAKTFFCGIFKVNLSFVFTVARSKRLVIAC